MPDEATTHAETYQRHGDPDPSKWQEADAVTGRPADVPPANSTMAERAQARAGVKQVDPDDVEDKVVAPAKVTAKRVAKKRA